MFDAFTLFLFFLLGIMTGVAITVAAVTLLVKLGEDSESN